MVVVLLVRQVLGLVETLDLSKVLFGSAASATRRKHRAVDRQGLLGRGHQRLLLVAVEVVVIEDHVADLALVQPHKQLLLSLALSQALNSHLVGAVLQRLSR